MQHKGPLLLACNHPNSFFDALLLGAYFKQPVHFLARGDAFKNSRAASVLTALKAIPIHRLKEGKEHLALNDATFDRCSAILQNGGIVLIFSEGLCLNEWRLRPLKKGGARIALDVWRNAHSDKELKILPVSFNYSSFKAFNKSVFINFGNEITRERLTGKVSEAEQMNELNKLICSELENGMLVEQGDRANLKFLLANSNGFNAAPKNLIEILRLKLQKLRTANFHHDLKKLGEDKSYPFTRSQLALAYLTTPLFALPALAGYLLHAPLYLPLQKVIKKKTEGTVFYHSALFASLIIMYPLYLLLISIVCSVITGNIWWMVMLAVMPLFAYVCIKTRQQLGYIVNYNLLAGGKRILLANLVLDQ